MKSLTDNDWNKEAARILKSQLALRGITYQRLAELLNNAGVPATKASIDSKISRGTFSAAFLIQCLRVIGCENLDLRKTDTITESTARNDE